MPARRACFAALRSKSPPQLERPMDDNRKKALVRSAGPDREAVRQGLDHAPGRRDRHARHRGRLDRLARPRHRARHRRLAARPRRRDLRAGVVGQDHADAAGRRRDPEARRHGRVHRRRARARSRSTPQKLGVNVDDLLDLAARHRRAGARDRRHAGALGRRRRHRHRLGRGARRRRPRSKARWATRTWACRRA